MIKRLSTVAAVLALSACAGTPIKVGEYTRTTRVDEPALNQVITRSLGEALVAKGVRTVGPAIEVNENTQFNKADGEASVMTCAVTAMAGTYFQRGAYTAKGASADCYGPVMYQISNSDGGTNWNCPGQMGITDICRDPAGKYFIALGMARVDLKQDFESIELTERALERKPNRVEKLIYNGRVGDSVKFLYQEFAEDIARPAFAQELQYDLGESSIIGFRSLRLEVLDANNTEIEYRLLSTF